MISAPRHPAFDAGAGAAYYVNPLAPWIYFQTPLHQPGVLSLHPSPSSPDRANLPPQHHAAANDDASSDILEWNPWLSRVSPAAQSADEDSSSSASSEEDGGRRVKNKKHNSTRPAVTPAPRKTSSDSKNAKESPVVPARKETWVPRRQPDRVEWDDIRGGILTWTSRSRNTELPQVDVPDKDIKPATDPAPSPPALPFVYPAPARSAPPSPQRQQRQNIDQAIFPPVHPIYPYTYTPAMSYAYLPYYYTPGTATFPPLPLPGAAPAGPSASFSLHPLIASTPGYKSHLIWNAVDTTSPTASYAHILQHRSSYQPRTLVGADTLDQPATYPATPFLHVRFGGESADLTKTWGDLTIESPSYKAFYDKTSARKSKKGSEAYMCKPVTIGDLLSEIHKFLHTKVTTEEWGEKPLFSSASFKGKVEETMKRRCWRGWTDGVKRIDVLGKRTYFAGAQVVPIHHADGRQSYGVEVSFSTSE